MVHRTLRTIREHITQHLDLWTVTIGGSGQQFQKQISWKPSGDGPALDSFPTGATKDQWRRITQLHLVCRKLSRYNQEILQCEKISWWWGGKTVERNPEGSDRTSQKDARPGRTAQRPRLGFSARGWGSQIKPHQLVRRRRMGSHTLRHILQSCRYCWGVAAPACLTE